MKLECLGVKKRCLSIAMLEVNTLIVDVSPLKWIFISLI